jgi:hypothetical protein
MIGNLVVSPEIGCKCGLHEWVLLSAWAAARIREVIKQDVLLGLSKNIGVAACKNACQNKW